MITKHSDVKTPIPSPLGSGKVVEEGLKSKTLKRQRRAAKCNLPLTFQILPHDSSLDPPHLNLYSQHSQPVKFIHSFVRLVFAWNMSSWAVCFETQ